MTGYRVTFADGSTIEHVVNLSAETVLDSARLVNGDGRGPVRITRVDIWDADTADRWPTIEEVPTHE